MFAGGVVSWLVLIPLFKFLGAHVQDVIYPGTMRLAQMAPLDVWKSYIRYIGAGAVTMAGLITLARPIPTLVSAFPGAFRQLQENGLSGGGVHQHKGRRVSPPFRGPVHAGGGHSLIRG